MKTTTCLLAALSGLAIAQEPVPGIPAGGPPAVAPTNADPAVDIVRSNIAIERIDATGPDTPIRWTYRSGGMDGALDRSGPVAYLGVSASPPPRELSAHLPIDADTGLMVEVIADDSPAQKAGLQANDVLIKLDDQVLIHPRQLSVLVANKKEGDSIKLTYIRKGETHEASAVLGKREMEHRSTNAFQATYDEHKLHAQSGAPGGKADILLESRDGGPVRTFVRRFNIPGGGGGEVAIAGGMAPPPVAGMDGPPPAVPAPPMKEVEDVKKELEAIRAMLETLQEKMK